MKRIDAVLKLREQRREMVDRFGVASLLLFGSTARDEALPESDVDLLVEFSQPVGLFHIISLQQHLESILGCKVDLGTQESLEPEVRDQAMREAIRIV